MLLDHVNLNQFRVFETVLRTGSMTAAARELHLTQPGVSQHVKTLEDALGVRLFDRLKGRLVPTPSARALYLRCSKALGEIEEGLAEAKGQHKELKGLVTLGMPIEFGNNLVVPLLARFSRKHPLVKFKLRLGWASEINTELLKGAMDFAFVDDYAMDRRVKTEPVFDEQLELCVSRKSAPSKEALSTQFFESLDYVEYAEGEPLLRMWFAHHLGPKAAKDIRLNVKAMVMDVQGVARFITSGAGAGVLPSYLAKKAENDGEGLHRFKGCGKPVINRISVAFLKEATPSPASSALRKYLKESLRPDT
jgi:DNA-binding transcriptional LysR family regulator